MAKTTQPILCCLGEQVAGSPTQFVIDRLLSANDLDWRVFTTEIQSEDVEAAIRGVAALHFSALRVVQGSRAVEKAILEHLLVQDPWSQFRVQCNAAGYEPSWVGWSSECAGLLWLLTHVVIPTPKRVEVYLHGDSELTRGVFHAYQIARRAEANGESHLQWVDGPEADLAKLAEESKRPYQTYKQVADLPNTLTADEVAVAPDTAEPAAMLFVGEDTEAIRSLIETAKIESNQSNVLCCSSTEWKQAINNLKPSPRLGDEAAINLVSPVDLASAALAHDFQRWTGTAANFQAIREAFEEFSEF